MVFHVVGKVEDFEELRPKIVTIEGKEIGIYRLRDQFYAYLNKCPHQGGPACEGIVQGEMVCELDESKHITKKYFSTEAYNLICPWHAVEYNLVTGVARGTIDGRSKIVLRKFETVVENGKVKVNA